MEESDETVMHPIASRGEEGLSRNSHDCSKGDTQCICSVQKRDGVVCAVLRLAVLDDGLWRARQSAIAGTYDFASTCKVSVALTMRFTPAVAHSKKTARATASLT